MAVRAQTRGDLRVDFGLLAGQHEQLLGAAPQRVLEHALDLVRRVQMRLAGGERAVLAVALARPRQRDRVVPRERDAAHRGGVYGAGRARLRAKSSSSSVSQSTSARPAAARSPCTRARVNLALISVRSSSRGAKWTVRSRSRKRTVWRRRERSRISIHSRSASQNATWSKPSRSKSAPSSRFITWSRFRLNSAVTPALSS